MTAPTVPGSTIQLRCGRQLGYGEYGDPAGHPVFVFHGTPGARNAAGFGHSAALERGLRIISPDRPGYGLSDFQPNRSLLDWPDDIGQLADALGIDRFDVLGVSGGGPHAAACAWKLPHRVRVAFLISAMGPVDHPRILASISRLQLLTLRVVQRLPLLVHIGVGLLALGIRTLPKIALRLLFLVGAEADRKSLNSEVVMRSMAESFREGFRGGSRGGAYEVGLLSRPWGFQPREIEIPVRVWHGKADRTVPPIMSRVVDQEIPESKATFIPEAGHLWVIENFASIRGIGEDAF